MSILVAVKKHGEIVIASDSAQTEDGMIVSAEYYVNNNNGTFIEETPRQLNSFAQFLDLTVVLDSMTNPSWRLSGHYLIDPRLSHLLLADGPFETL